jgi:hypothetical protein
LKLAYADTSYLLAITFGEPGSSRLACRLAQFDVLLSSNLLEAEFKSALSREGVEGETGDRHPDTWLSRELRMNISTRIHWIRVLVGGFLAEASVFAVVIPVFMISGQHALLYAAPLASLVMCFLFALWVGRRLESRFILHGALVGVVATLLYVGLTLARPEPLAYLAAHALKILGGAAGGLLASRRRRPATTVTDVPTAH